MSLRERPLAVTHVLWWVPVLASVIMWEPCRGDDTSCLRGFKASILDGGGRLSGWTDAAMASPCTSLDGVGCSSNRVVSIVLNVSGLVGTISPSLADCSNLQTLDLSSNLIDGPLPPNIGNLSYLTALNLSNNQLSGNIPLALSACTYLNYLDLHGNRLSGSIPAQLGILPRLSFFDVSDNRLSGLIPSTLSNTSSGAPRFNASSFEGNKDLYGYPLPPPTNHKLTVLAIVGIGLGSGLLSLIVSFAAVCIWLRVSEQGYAAQEGKISQLMSES